VFEDSLFASTARPSPRRGWTAAVSFGIQAMLLGIAVLVPLVYTDALPVGNLKNFVEIPPPPGPPGPPQQELLASRHRATEIENTILRQPPSIPPQVTQVVDEPEATAPGNDNGVIGMPPGIGRGSQVINNIIAATTNNVAPPPPPSTPHTIRLSGGVTEGLLIHKITPTYPKIAIMARQQGSVILQATIGRDGTIQNLHYVSGPGLLIEPAMDAVKQWRYRPYLLNNQPVDVETQITVNFSLGN